MGPDQVVVDHGPEHVVVHWLDDVDLVRGAEPIEEVQERDSGFQRGGVRDDRQVLGRLHRGGGQHGPACGPGRHHVAVVPEDRQGVRGDGAGRPV